MVATSERTAEQLLRAVADEADQLRALVSAMLGGSYQEDGYLWDVASLCRSKPAFARQLLALIDRYQRLGQMPAAQYWKIKEKIEQSLATDSMTEAPEAARDDERASTLTTEVPVASAAPVVPPRRSPLPLQSAASTVTAQLPAAPEPPAPPPTPTAPPTIPPIATMAAARATPHPSAAPRAPAPPVPPPPRATQDSPGSVIGPGTILRQRYELTSLLGFGGMASVFAAVDRYRAHLGLENCRVALKIIAPHPPNPSHVTALGREFHNAQQLSHPNIINVYEIDHEGDASFYTMELLEGEQLNQLLERIGGAPSQHQALAIIRDIGNAIAHAHARGVVHADLKPQNIFITYGGQVRMLDFGGLSLSPAAANTHTPHEPWIKEFGTGLSSTAYRTATPAYASCEQLEGHRAEPRDDVYALGCIAYELLSGHHPFDGKSATQARAQHLRARRPPMLRSRTWRALRSALAWRREQRPAQIEPWLEQLGVAAAVEQLPPSHQLQAAAPPRLWARRFAAAALLLLIATVGGVVLDPRGNLSWQQILLNAKSTVQSAQQKLNSAFGAASPVAPSSAPSASIPASGAVRPANHPDILRSAQAGSPSVPVDPLRARPHHHAQMMRATAAPELAGTAPDGRSPALSIDAAEPVADAPTPGVAFASSSYSVADSAPAARLIVRRKGHSRGEIPFVWWTQEDSAKADVDYAPLGRRLEHIPRGEDAVTIYVPIISNPLRHHTETFYVMLGVPGDVDSTVPGARAAVTIERGG